MEARSQETAEEELARLRGAQEEAERAGRPPEAPVAPPPGARQQEAANAEHAAAAGRQERAAEESMANRAKARSLLERFRSETAETQADSPPEDPAPPRRRWGLWRR